MIKNQFKNIVILLCSAAQNLPATFWALPKLPNSPNSLTFGNV
jgi:hypothetical protein